MMKAYTMYTYFFVSDLGKKPLANPTKFLVHIYVFVLLYGGYILCF